MSVLNKAKVRQLLLSDLNTRYHKFKRVSAEVYEHLDNLVVQECRHLIQSAPTAGQTLYPPIRIKKETYVEQEPAV